MNMYTVSNVERSNCKKTHQLNFYCSLRPVIQQLQLLCPGYGKDIQLYMLYRAGLVFHFIKDSMLHMHLTKSKCKPKRKKSLTDFVSLWGIMMVRNSLTVSGLCLLHGVFVRYFSVWGQKKMTSFYHKRSREDDARRRRGHVPTSYMMVLRFCCPALCLLFPLSFLCSFKSVRSLNTWPIHV